MADQGEGLPDADADGGPVRHIPVLLPEVLASLDLAPGKIILDDDPTQVEVVRCVLGHTRIDTTLKTYVGLSSRLASKVWAAAPKGGGNGTDQGSVLGGLGNLVMGGD